MEKEILRYERNIGTITEAEQEILCKSSVIIAGCGGLGGYAAEFLSRLGIGKISLVDGDVFNVANLNRQLNSLEENIGAFKAEETKNRLLRINSSLSVFAHNEYLSEENAEEILKNHDIIIDALDNVNSRLLLEKWAAFLGIPLVHGAVKEWYVQVSVIYPGDNSLSLLYKGRGEESVSIPSFTPAFCASIQVSQAVKVLLKKDNIYRNKLFTANLLDGSFDIISLNAV